MSAVPSLPFQSAHLAMIDTLMMAYTAEMVSVEKVIACAQRYSAFFQATDLPYDIEDAVMYWINKVGARGGPWPGTAGSSLRRCRSAADGGGGSVPPDLCDVRR